MLDGVPIDYSRVIRILISTKHNLITNLNVPTILITIIAYMTTSWIISSSL